MTVADGASAKSRRFAVAVPRVWLVAGGGWAGRIVQVLCQLAAVRIMTDDLGTSGYSVFAVLASLVNWFALSDFSLGISLQNHISERRVAEQQADDVALTAMVLALGCVATTALLLFVVGPSIARLLLSGFTFLTPEQRVLAFWAMAFPSIGTALGGVAYRIWFAQHRGYLANLLPALGTIIGTSAVWSLSRLRDAPDLIATTLVFYAPLAALPLAVLAGMAWRMSRRQRFQPTLVRPLLRRAGSFWLIGISAALVLQIDYVIIAQVLGSEDVVVYNVASKVFALILFVYSALILALWPVCAEALARGDVVEVSRLVRRYIAAGLAFALISGVAFGLLEGWIMATLAPATALHVPLIVTLLLTVYTMVRIWCDTYAMVLQSMNDLAPFWIAVPLQAAFSIALQVAGARLFGLPGVIAGLILCFVLTVAWMLPRRLDSHVDAHAVSS